jgi:hypothetical protein
MSRFSTYLFFTKDLVPESIIDAFDTNASDIHLICEVYLEVVC